MIAADWHKEVGASTSCSTLRTHNVNTQHELVLFCRFQQVHILWRTGGAGGRSLGFHNETWRVQTSILERPQTAIKIERKDSMKRKRDKLVA